MRKIEASGSHSQAAGRRRYHSPRQRVRDRTGAAVGGGERVMIFRRASGRCEESAGFVSGCRAHVTPCAEGPPAFNSAVFLGGKP